MELTEFIQSDRMKLFIFVPKVGIQVVCVTKNAHVSILNNLFPGEKKIYIHKGTVMNKTQTLKYYDVADSDGIVAIPLDDYIADKNQWQEVTNDQERFSLQLKKVIDPSIKREQDRLCDLKFARIEMRPQSFRKLKNIDTDYKPITHRTVIPEIPELPIENPLPVFW